LEVTGNSNDLVIDLDAAHFDSIMEKSQPK
jgi:hypothetical protein